MLIRHGEKPAPEGGPHGVSTDGGHHQTLGAIVAHLGRVAPAPPPAWPDDRFDVVYVLTGRGRRWRFAQVPQLLLPGDLPAPIAG